MRKWILIAVGACSAALAMTVDVPRSEAAIVYPWCLYLGGKNGAMSCGYVSFEQCMASSQGSSWCGQNPFYEPPQPVRRVRRVQ